MRPPNAGPEEMAYYWLLNQAWQADLTPKLKLLAAEGPIDSGTGKVGYYAGERNEASADAAVEIARAWFQTTEPDERIIGLLMALDLGASNVGAVAKILHPFDRKDAGWKQGRDDFLDDCLTTATVAKFGVIK